MTKKTLSIVSLALLFAVLVPLSVTMSASEVNCRVPFSFIVGGRTLAPGPYSISTTQGYMVLRGVSHSSIVLTMAAKERAGGAARLVFLKSGDRYDLTEVWSGDGNGAQLPPSKRRNADVRAANAPVERIVIVANTTLGTR